MVLYNYIANQCGDDIQPRAQICFDDVGMVGIQQHESTDGMSVSCVEPAQMDLAKLCPPMWPFLGAHGHSRGFQVVQQEIR